MKALKDQLGRQLQISGIPKRIVSLVPSQTELLVDLGLEESIVGITKFCVHPEHLKKEKPVVGGTKKVRIGKIAELRPDIILCNKEENTREMVEKLQKIAPVHVSDVKDMADSMELVEQYGDIFGKKESAKEISSAILEVLADFLEFIKTVPRKRVAYLIWRSPWMAAGGDTFIDHLLDLNKFDNVFKERNSRYPVIELEDLNDLEVEFVLLSTEPFPFKEVHKTELRPVVKEAMMEIVDGEYFSWYGSRLRFAFSYFKKLQIHLRSL